MALLEVRNLTVSYGLAAATRSISLDVQEGEVVGVIGPNGAGKTSTLLAIMGMVKEVAGSIVLDGRPLLGEAPERIVRLGVSLVPEGRRIFANMTVEENLRLGTSAGRGGAASAEIDRVLAEFPILVRHIGTPAGKLSGGEQQQLAIARALVARPRVLLLDEPSLGLAPRLVDAVFATLERLRGEGMTVLLVEQNAMRTVAFADRTYVVRSGSVVVAGLSKELMARPDIANTYLGG